MGAEDFKRLSSPTKVNMAAIVDRTDWVHTGITDYHITDRDDLCLVEFQSTKGREDWKSNFKFLPNKERWFADRDLYLHRGFLGEYKAVRSAILDHLYRRKPQFMVINGYSLGAALTQICAQDAAYHFPDAVIGGTGYAPPRPFYGNRSNLKTSTLTLVCAHCDPVCLVPPFGKHYGSVMKVGNWNSFETCKDPDTGKVWHITHYWGFYYRYLDAVGA